MYVTVNYTLSSEKNSFKKRVIMHFAMQIISWEFSVIRSLFFYEALL